MATRVLIVTVNIDTTVAIRKGDRRFFNLAYDTCCTLLSSVDNTCYMEILNGCTLHIAERSGILSVKPCLTGSIADGQRVASAVECTLERFDFILSRYRGNRILCITDVASQLDGLIAIGAAVVHT